MILKVMFRESGRGKVASFYSGISDLRIGKIDPSSILCEEDGKNPHLSAEYKGAFTNYSEMKTSGSIMQADFNDKDGNAFRVYYDYGNAFVMSDSGKTVDRY